MALSNLKINELTWNERGQWPIEIKVIFCLLVVALTFSIFYFIIIKPTFEVYDELIVNETQLKTEYEKKYDETVNLNTYKKQLAEMEERFGVLLKQLPTKNEMPALLAEISKTGTNIGLTFELFAPKKEIIFPQHVELPVEIAVVGSYHQLAVFVSRVAQISRIITLHDFEVKFRNTDAEGHENTLLDQERLVMTLTIKIYRYRS
jgi:type IV pilus assembly protein PilO